MIRNVMIVAPFGMERELRHLAKSLDGQVLKPEEISELVASKQAAQRRETVELRGFAPPRSKFIARCYLGTSTTWKTVTPVILPGHDDKKASKTERLIQKALRQSGIESACEFSWQSFPFLKNCLSAHKYDRDGRHTGYHRPAHLKDLTAVHLCLTFKNPVPGPVIVGAGRHCGLGLFACE
jgi:CRISPR-associated protein Csb2